MISWTGDIETIAKYLIMNLLLSFQDAYNHFCDVSLNFLFVPFQDWITEELINLEITTTCSLGYPMIMEFVMLNGIGSMPEIIAANVAWIWSVLKPNKNMNGSSKSWEVSTILYFLDYALLGALKVRKSIYKKKNYIVPSCKMPNNTLAASKSNCWKNSSDFCICKHFC